jgi:putative glutamine amidotransferase
MKKPVILVATSDNDKAERYTAVVTKHGGSPRVVTPAIAGPSLDSIGGILFTGGNPDIAPARYGAEVDPRSVAPDLPRDAFELDLFREAKSRDLPVLGICRGFQLLNVAMGGKLAQHVDGHSSQGGVSGQHWIDVQPACRLARLVGMHGPLHANSRHHQAVVNSMLGVGVKPSAYSPDGLVEVIEAPSWRWFMGIQCHPERQDEVDPRFDAVFADFVNAARKTADR